MSVPLLSVSAKTQPCAHHHCSMFVLELMAVRLAPEQAGIGFQATMKTYLEVVGSHPFVKAHALILSDLSALEKGSSVSSFPEQESGPSLQQTGLLVRRLLFSFRPP